MAFANSYVPTEENPDNVEVELLDSAVIDEFRLGIFTAAPGSEQVTGGFDVEGGGFTAAGSSSASADTATGELKASSSTSVDAFAAPADADETEVRNGDESATGNGAGAGLSEVFTVNGTGTAAFSALVDVSWDGNILFNAFVRARNLETGENYLPTAEQKLRIESYDFQAPQPTGSVTDDLISLMVDFSDASGEQIEVFWDIGGFNYASDSCFDGENCLQPANSMFDASGTANIFYSATAGLDVFSTSTGFLSESEFQTYTPGNPQVVPLPATGLLLIGGIAGLGALRRRGRVRA